MRLTYWHFTRMETYSILRRNMDGIYFFWRTQHPSKIQANLWIFYTRMDISNWGQPYIGCKWFRRKKLNHSTHKTEGVNRTKNVRFYPFVFTGKWTWILHQSHPNIHLLEPHAKSDDIFKPPWKGRLVPPPVDNFSWNFFFKWITNWLCERCMYRPRS